MNKQTFTTVANIKARRALTCNELGACQGVRDGQNCFDASKREQAGNYHPTLVNANTRTGWREWLGVMTYRASVAALAVLAVGASAGYVYARWLA